MAAITFPTPTQIKNVQDPSLSSDAATKNYVDSQISGGNVAAAGSNTQVQFNNNNVFAASANFVFDSSTSILTVTGNIVTNYITANGSLLTNLPGANVTGTVANATFAVSANTVRTAAQPNITSVGTLTSLNSSGNITAPNIIANTGRFVGNGAGLTNIPGANVTGTVANANYSAYSGTVTGSSQSNITSVGSLTGLTVSNATGVVNFVTTANVSLGSVSNLHIDGGSSGYVLKTDGLGNLSWGTDSATPAGSNQEVQFNNSSSFGTSSNFTFDTSYNGGGGSLTVGYGNGGAIFTDTINANVSITSVGAINTSANINSANANLGNLASANYFSGNGYLLTGLTGANVTGTVANATYAISSGTVRTAAQPNITSTGTLTSLNVSGNITAPNIIANTGRFIGNGAGLTNLTGANVTGQVGNALIAGTVYTAAQPNITSVGTLTSLSVTGNISAGNVAGGNLVSANYLSGDGYLISNLTIATGTSIVNGNSNVVVSANSNVTISANGVSNVVVVTDTGANVTGYVDVTGNLTAANVAGGNLVSANFISGNGSLLSAITGSNVSGNVSTAVSAYKVANGTSNVNIPSVNGNVTVGVAGFSNILTVTSTGVNIAGYLNTGTGNITTGNIAGGNLISATYLTGTLTTAAQPNITSVGSLTGLTVSNATGVVNFNTTANVTLGNVSNLHISGGSSGYYLTTDGSGGLSFVSPPGGGGIAGNNTEVQFNDGGLFGADANFTYNKTTDTLGVKNLTLEGTGTLSGGNLVSANYITGTLTTANQSNITTVGTLTDLAVGGNATISGNLTVSGTTIYANITTLNVKDPIIEMGGNPNGTPLNTNDGKDRGTLLHYYVTANSSAVDAFMGWDNSGGEFIFGSNVTNSSEVITVNNYGNVHAGYFIGNGSQLTGTIANANYSTYAGTVLTAAQPNITSVGTLSSLTVTGNVQSGNVDGGNLVSANYLTGTLTTGNQSNITTVGTLGNLTVSGNVYSNNMNVTNDVHVLNLYAGNLLAANYFSGDGSLLTNVPASGGSAATALLASYVTGNAQSNITSVGTLTSLTIANSGNGNLTSDNANLGNLATANYFSGNGYLLTGITGANVSGTVANANYAAYAGNVINATQSNITTVGTLTTLAVSGNITTGSSNKNQFINLTANALEIRGGWNDANGLVSLFAGDYANGGPFAKLSVLANTNTISAEADTFEFHNKPNNATLLKVSNSTTSTSTTTGALQVSGGAGVTGNLYVGANLVSANANLGNTATANYLTGALTTAAQPNITSVGTLTSLTVTGNISAGNVAGGNLVSANYLSGDGYLISNLSITAGSYIVNGNSNVDVSANSNVTISVAGNTNIVTVTGTGVNVAGYLNTGSGNITSGNANLGNAVRGNFFIGNGALLTDITGANVTGTVANANYSTYAGTVLTNAQPNITSVGTLSSLSVTGNISAGNVAGGNLVNANFISGNGSYLSSITGANVTGTVANATYAVSAGSATTAGTVTTASQPNITSVGTLSSLSVTGNITSGNANLGNLAKANYFQGDGSLLTNISVSAGSQIINGNSNVSVAPNSNVTVGVNGVADVVIIADNGVNIAGYLNIGSGNLTSGNANLGNLTVSNYFSGNGSLLSSITGSNVTGQVGNALVAGTVYTASQPNITSVGTLTSLNVTANIVSGNANLGNAVRGNFFIGNGALLTAITGANVTGTVANANYSTYAGTVLTAAQPNITSVGTLSSLSVTGNISAGNIAGGNLVSANYLSGDGYLISNITVAAGSSIVNGNSNVVVAANANVTVSVAGNVDILTVYGVGANIAGVLDVSGNLSANNTAGGNLVSANYFSGSGNLLSNIQAANITGTVANANYSTYAGTVITAAQSNITSVGTLTGLTISGTGSVSGANLVSANYLTGTLTTAAQPNITSVGSLTSLTITANGNIFLSGTASRVTGANLVSATYLTGTLTTASQPNITSVGTLNNTTLGGSNSLTGGNLVSANYLTGTLTTAAQPNITSVGTLTDTTLGGSNSLTGGNLLSANYLTGTLTTAAQPNITSVGTLTSLSVTGNISSGNANLGNLATANYFSGTLTTASQPNVTTVGTLTNLDVGGNTTIAGNLTVSGTTIYANITTLNVKDPIIEMGGNPNGTPLSTNDGKDRGTLLHYYVTANSTPVDAFMGWDNSGSEFIFGSNVTNSSEVITVNNYGNVHAGWFIGNGSQLTGVIANANYSLYAGTVLTAAQPNITSVGTLTSLAVTGDVTAGNVYANSGTIGASLLTGTLTTTSQPNVTSLGTLTSLTVTGTTTSGNFATAGNITASYLVSNVATGTAPLTVSSTTKVTNLNADYLDGYDTSTSATANTVAVRDANGNVTANFFTGNGYYLTGIISSSLSNGNSNIAVLNNANITLSSTGTANVVVVTGTGVNIAGTLNIGGGQFTTTGNANVANLNASSGIYGTIQTASQTNITTLGTLTNTTLGASNSLTGGNLVSANYLTGTLTTAAQPNITSVGTLTSLTVTGTTTSGNFATAGNITASFLVSNVATGTAPLTVSSQTKVTNLNADLLDGYDTATAATANTVTVRDANGNVSANFFTGNGYYLTGISSSSLANGNSNIIVENNANVTISSTGTANVVVVTGTGVNVAGTLNIGSGQFTTTGNANVANLNASAGIYGTIQTASQTNITTLGTLNNTTLGASNSLTGGNLLSANYLTGTLTTAAQPNITSVGTLTSLTVTGTTTSGNFATAGNITASYLVSNIATGTAPLTVASTTKVTNLNADYLDGYDSSTTATANTVVVRDANANIAGNNISGTLTTASQTNITSVGTLGSLTVTGTTTSGNFATAGNITASYLVSNVATGTAPLTVSSTTKVTNLNADYLDGYDSSTSATANTVVIRDGNGNITGNVLSATDASISGNATITGNLTVNGTTIYANVTTLNVKDPIIEMGGNPNGTPLSTNDGKDRGTLLHYYVTANTTAVDAFMGWDNSNAEFALGSNVTNSSEVMTFNNFGNLRAGYYFGNASQLVGTIANANYSLYAGTVITAAQPNITSVGTLTDTTLGGSNSLTGGNLLSANYLTGTLTTAAQPNITSHGTLTSLTSTGTINFTGASNVSLGSNSIVKITGGSSGQVLTTDGSGGLSWSSVSTTSINNGNSNVVVAANANVTISSNGVANVVSVSSTGVTLVANGNITMSGTVSQISGANLISGTYLAGTLTTAAQPNITSVGTLTSVTTSGGVIATGTGYVKTSNIQDSSGTITIVTGYGSVSGDVGVYGNLVIGTKGSGDLTTYGITATGNIAFSGPNVSLGSVSNLKIAGGSANYVLKTDGAGNLSWIAGGSGVPGGSNTQVQFNDSSSFAGNSTFTFDKTTSLLSVGNLTVTGVTTLSSNANVKITGGSSGQALVTDGAGNLTWTSLGSSPLYEFDDLSYSTDGVTGTFQLTYNQVASTITDPFSILVAVNGAIQSGFVWNVDVIWQSFVLGAYKGYTIINTGYITFVTPPPPASDIMVRTQTGTTSTNVKKYPFSPADIMFGY